MPNDKQDKLTTDLADGNRAILDQLKEDNRWNYGYTINTMISTFGNMPVSVKKYLLGVVKQKLKELNKRMDVAEVFELGELAKEYDAYDNIAKFLNDGRRITLEDFKIDPLMQKIAMQDGYLICPENWKIVNPEDAKECLYAGVIECRNSSRLGIPHYLYFCNYRYGGDYPEGFTDEIDKKVATLYPEFKDVLAKQVTLIVNPDNPETFLNADEWMESPTIGHFSIYIQGDPLYGKNYDPPAGTRIVRDKITEDWGN